MNRLLQSSWMVSLVGCLLYVGTTVALIQPSRLAGARPAAAGVKPAAAIGPSWDFRDPGFEQMVEDLKAQKEQVSQREQALTELETRLQAERQEIASITQAVWHMQEEFDANALRLKEADSANLKKMARLHAAMSPEASASILRELGDQEAAQILAYMKVDEASAVLEALTRLGKEDAKRAALLSERLRHVVPANPATKTATTP